VGVFREGAMRKSIFLDRCLGAVVLLALLALFTAGVIVLADKEPRITRMTLILPSRR
jgi:hypothetical protein